MKKLVFLITFLVGFLLCTGDILAQTPVAVDTVVSLDDILTQIGDTLVIVLDSQTVVVPLKDSKDVFTWIIEVVDSYKETNPQGALAIIGWFVSILLSGAGLSRFVQIKRVWDTIKKFFTKKNSPANFVAIGSLGLAIAISLIMGSFNVVSVFSLTGTVYMIAHLAYKNFFQEKE